MLMLAMIVALVGRSRTMQVVSKKSTSTEVERHQPTLYVVTPAHLQDIEQWSSYLATVLTAEENDDGKVCSFGRTVMTTIVSDEHERQAFKKRLALVQSSCSTNVSRIDEVHIRTLAEVLRSTKAVVEHDMGFVTPSNVLVYQGTKKFYGCLDAASISGVQAHRGDTCFMVDSDSRLLRNSFCHIASEYQKHKTVFFSPYPDANHIKHDDCIEYSRKVLGQSLVAGGSGDIFGEFYAMESYHWMFEVELVQAYLQTLPLAVLAVNLTRTPEAVALENLTRPPSLDPQRAQCIYPEEVMYHFLYPRRQAWGYHYVDAYDMLKNIVGEHNFHTMVRSANPRQAIMESVTDRVYRLTPDNAQAIGEALRDHGVLQIRCSRIDEKNVQAVLESMDMCGSLYTRGTEDDSNIRGVNSDIPACLSP